MCPDKGDMELREDDIFVVSWIPNPGIPIGSSGKIVKNIFARGLFTARDRIKSAVYLLHNAGQVRHPDPDHKRDPDPDRVIENF